MWTEERRVYVVEIFVRSMHVSVITVRTGERHGCRTYL